jgi:hypothetical protein
MFQIVKLLATVEKHGGLPFFGYAAVKNWSCR